MSATSEQDPDGLSVDIDLLARVLDALLPPSERLPGAGGLGLGRVIASDAQRAPGLGGRARSILERLDPDGSDDSLVEALAAAERASPESFRSLLILAYSAYYRDERVRADLEEWSGYPTHPPQPDGYPLPAFNTDLLEHQRMRAPFWRDVGGGAAGP